MRKCISLAACIGLIIVIGCSQESPKTPAPQASNSASAVDGSKYLLNEEPDAAEDVIKVREAAKDGDDILIVGRIGGSEVPWVKGRAAFSIVDASLKSCDEVGSDGCPKPWDFC